MKLETCPSSATLQWLSKSLEASHLLERYFTVVESDIWAIIAKRRCQIPPLLRMFKFVHQKGPILVKNCPERFF